VFACLAVLKGLRLPGLWAATQAYLDYHDGFIKRGLLGEVLKGLGVPLDHYASFAMASAVMLLVLAVLLLSWIRMSGVRVLADGMVVAVFAASFILTYLVQLIGYLEIPEAMLALLALMLSGTRWRLAAALVAGIAGVLVHENYLLTFVPVTLLPSILLTARSSRSWRGWLPVAGVLLILIAGVLLVALGASLTAQQVVSLQASMTASADFPPRGDFFAVLTRSAGSNFAIMQQTMLANGAWWLAQANAFIVFIPTTALFLWLSLRVVQDCHAGTPGRGVVKAAVLLTGLSPLALQLVGWDIYRWYALAGLTSFLTLTVVCFYYRPSLSLTLAGSSSGLRNLAVLFIAVNLASGTGLFDGYRVDTFPFVDHWRGLLEWITRGWQWAQPTV